MLTKKLCALCLWLPIASSATAETHIQHCTLNADYIYTVSNGHLSIKALSNTLSLGPDGTISYNARHAEPVDENETKAIKQITNRLITSNLQRLDYQFENKLLNQIVNEIENRDIDSINAKYVDKLLKDVKAEFTHAFYQQNGNRHYHRQVHLSLGQQLVTRFQQDLDYELSNMSEDGSGDDVEENADLYAAKALRKIDRLNQDMNKISDNICEEVRQLHRKEIELKRQLPNYSLTMAKVEKVVL